MLERLNTLREERRSQHGFTLIELLIVIVILGVLAAIVVFAVGGINDTSKKSACQADYKNVEIASEAFYAQANPHAYAVAAGVDGVDNLIAAKLLREAPSTSNGYTITYHSDGSVTATGACTLP